MSHPPELLTFLLATLTVAREQCLAVTTVTQGPKATHTHTGKGEKCSPCLSHHSQVRKTSTQGTEILAV